MLTQRDAPASSRRVEAAPAVECWCGSPDYRSVFAGAWNRGGVDRIDFEVAKCADCDLARTVPAPDESRYSKGESHWADASTADAWSVGIARNVVGRAPGPRILDIGCSVGNVVAAASEFGAHAEGIDLDPIAIDRGRALGRNVRCRGIDAQEGEWDGISLNHVLEHIGDLRPFMGHVGRLTAAGGVVCIQVPSHQGLVPRLMGDHWFAWAPNEHVWHFEPATLVRVVEGSSDLRLEQVTQRGMIEPSSPGPKGRAKRAIARAGSMSNRGDQVEAVFRKPL